MIVLQASNGIVYARVLWNMIKRVSLLPLLLLKCVCMCIYFSTKKMKNNYCVLYLSSVYIFVLFCFASNLKYNGQLMAQL